MTDTENKDKPLGKQSGSTSMHAAASVEAQTQPDAGSIGFGCDVTMADALSGQLGENID